MLRHNFVMSVLMMCALECPAGAETIGPDGKYSASPSKSDPGLLDESFQALVAASGDSDWRDSPGADVWWLSDESVMAQVKVFPMLQHPGNAEPQCCVSFTVGDTEFWIKVRNALAADRTGTTRARENSKSRGNGTGVQGPALTYSGTSGDHGSPTADASAPSDASTFEPSFVTSQQRADGINIIAQVPEPSSVFLLAIGLAATARRARLAKRR